MKTMRGRICIVTGSNSGIGKETALDLAGMGATVVMVVRNRKRGEAARDEVVQRAGNGSIDLMMCDLSSMDSIRQFARAFENQYDKLHVLINNAGAFFHNRQVTVDGFEKTLAVNYLAPFLLTHELLPLLKANAPSRVINVSSGMHTSGTIDFDDLQGERRYSAIKAYANSKLMLLMFTYELARRLEGSGVTMNAVHPGFAATSLGTNSGSLLIGLVYKLTRPFQISASEGAETSVYLASSPEVEEATGKYFIKKREEVSSPISYDEQLQRRLFDTTIELLGLEPGV